MDARYSVVHRRDSLANGLGEQRQGEAVQHHREGLALGDPLSRGDDFAVAAPPTQEELGRLPVAVEAKPGTVGPAVTHGPEHGLSAEFVEAVGRIDQEDGRGFRRGEAHVVGDGCEGLVDRHVGEGDGKRWSRDIRHQRSNGLLRQGVLGVRQVGGRSGDQIEVGKDVPHGMDGTFNAGLEAGTDVEIAACRRRLRANCL